MGDTGIEPVSRSCRPAVNKELTENQKPVLSIGLDTIVQKYPELVKLIQTWPNLSEHIKTAIKALIQTNRTEKK
jgi:hypothetical protein